MDLVSEIINVMYYILYNFTLLYKFSSDCTSTVSTVYPVFPSHKKNPL